MTDLNQDLAPAKQKYLEFKENVKEEEKITNLQNYTIFISYVARNPIIK